MLIFYENIFEECPKSCEISKFKTEILLSRLYKKKKKNTDTMTVGVQRMKIQTKLTSRASCVSKQSARNQYMTVHKNIKHTVLEALAVTFT